MRYFQLCNIFVEKFVFNVEAVRFFRDFDLETLSVQLTKTY